MQPIGASHPVHSSADTTKNPFSSFSGSGQTSIRCVDLDNDGDRDCVLGLSDGSIAYYKNTGSASAPAFTVQTGGNNPFNGFSVASNSNAAVALGDFDGDLDLDLIVGDSAGAIQYYKNTGSTSAPAFTLQTGSANDPFDAIALYDTNSNPDCLDFDMDGDIDCFFGTGTGFIRYVKNTGTRSAPIMTLTKFRTTFDATDTNVVSMVDMTIDVGATFYNLIATGDKLQYARTIGGLSTGHSVTGLADLANYFVLKRSGTTKILLYSNHAGATATYANTAAEAAAAIQLGGQGGVQSAFSTDSALTNMDPNPFEGIDVGTNAALSCMDIDSNCAMFSNCNTRGTCYGSGQCACYDGWGSPNDVTIHRSADCATRTCPSGKAWVDIPTSATAAHGVTECSNQGLCDRSSGNCKCNFGFTGDACQRIKCPTLGNGECSGHGRCVSIKRMATMTSAMPLSSGSNSYTGNEDTTTWDENMAYGCICDSSWTVGLGSGQSQLSEYFGVDCSLRRCPSGNDPVIAAAGGDVTNCGGVVAAGGFGTGATHNLCHVDCSNRGTCDHSTGTCSCFEGFWGQNCGNMDALSTGT